MVRRDVELAFYLVNQLSEGVVAGQPDAVVPDMQCCYALCQVGIKAVELLALLSKTLNLASRRGNQ